MSKRTEAICGLKRHIAWGAMLVLSAAEPAARAETSAEMQSLIDRGAFAEAEQRLLQQIPDPTAPTTSDAAIQFEILRRTRHDFSLSGDEVLREIKEFIPDAAEADVTRWTADGDLQGRQIDGEMRYFREAVGNLFRFSSDAQRRRAVKPAVKPRFDLDGLLVRLVDASETSAGPEIYPVKHHVVCELVVHDRHPRLTPGAKVRAWLPFPQEYRQQRDVRLIDRHPPGGIVADAAAPQRSIYFEQTVGDDAAAPRFRAEYEFVTSAYCPQLDLDQVKPYDTTSELFREYTAERLPHIVFTPTVRSTVREIVGEETNPLTKARLIFRWVSQNLPWCSEMEYSIIPNIPAKGLEARRGDCGVAGLTFITLCRAAGVPARWQSGWGTKPGERNMHDWSEFYVEPWGWLPADASYGVRQSEDPRVRDFFCGHMDPYRMIVNLDYARQLQPPKTSFRSEPNDFQRGEVEIDGHNLYFDEWDWKFTVETTPPGATAAESGQAAGR